MQETEYCMCCYSEMYCKLSVLQNNKFNMLRFYVLELQKENTIVFEKPSVMEA